jgi:hypothetical protein
MQADNNSPKTASVIFPASWMAFNSVRFLRIPMGFPIHEVQSYVPSKQKNAASATSRLSAQDSKKSIDLKK